MRSFSRFTESCIIIMRIRCNYLAKITSVQCTVQPPQNASAGQYRGIRARRCLGEVGDLQLKDAAKKKKKGGEKGFSECRSVSLTGGYEVACRNQGWAAGNYCQQIQAYTELHTPRSLVGKWVNLGNFSTNESLQVGVIWICNFKFRECRLGNETFEIWTTHTKWRKVHLHSATDC